MTPKASSRLQEAAVGIRAVQYVRASTEHQKYSIANQVDTIRQYAERHGIEIVRTYADEGRSGVTFNRRDGIKRLISDVQRDKPGFSTILVYDVSRWGRFQDADEGAYYEFLCKRRGITVQYCAEQFENDGGALSTIVKGLKRAMAGEYSRELSAKVFEGQRRLATYGFFQGGPPGYGLRRLLVDEAGIPKGRLEKGQHKNIMTDRVILVPGPDTEVATVQWIFREFVNEKKRQRDIMDILNEHEIPAGFGRCWTKDAVHTILTNERYIGNNVWNRATKRLGTRKAHNSPDKWIRTESAFKPIIGRSLFERAAKRLNDYHSLRYASDEELLKRLKLLWETHGYLSCPLINSAENLPTRNVYQNRFGGLLRAYKLIGYKPDRDYHYVDDLRPQIDLRLTIVDTVVLEMRRRGATVVQNLSTKVLTVNNQFTVLIRIVRCQEKSKGCLRWEIRFDRKKKADIHIAVRLNRTNDTILDYYIFPKAEITGSHLRFSEHNDVTIAKYRTDTLEPLYRMATVD